MNYPVTGLIVLAVLIGIIYLIKRNRKDEKDFEKQIGRSDIKPERHNDPENRP
ncbi:Loki-CTERM sorting domain-containing protein [Mucilaginibacter agri]|uniref:Loki-CTERM sorting domain-containing protein n=1 Tax=Mucilaginibacter agri TaxID=2695265 RepID=UPI0014127F94|nr:hypothetical protein [Mucilaginibacter agri]